MTSTFSATMARRVRRTGLAASALSLAALLSAPAAGAGQPSEVVDAMASATIAVLRDGSLSSAAKRQRVEEIIYVNVDFDTLSRLVLARNWRHFSDAQRQVFSEEFKKHLSVTYGNNVDDYSNETVDIISERPEKRGDVTVRSKVVRGDTDDIWVDYRLRKRDGRWLIIDFIVEGVSLVSNFRSQFQEIISSGGPERLLRLLREKNAAEESLDK